MVCIYYHPEAYSMSGPKLMGRNAAGSSFLRAFLERSADRPSPIYVLTSEESHYHDFVSECNAYNKHAECRAITKHNLQLAEEAGTIFYPGPNIEDLSVKRTLWSNTRWSLCGITHTTSSMAAMDAICSWVSSPVQPWDAVICTSTAVKKNVEAVLQSQVNALRNRLGITKVVLPLLPVIPLGLHTNDFIFSPEQRTESRNQIGATKDTLVVLYMGRLSFHAKAHPLAMYTALEKAAQNTDQNIVLIECGWHANSSIKESFTAAAELACPSVRVVHLDGREAQNRDIAWASADIFCSLSDNIQETFGIVPLEAMAAGLPVVVSDWDGYKDTVRDGVDGFRIPTIAPGPGLAGDIAHRHALEIDTYDMYCGHSGSMVGLDAEKLTSSFVQLFSSPTLRKKMGAAGRKHVADEYDWGQIMLRYEELWDEQRKIRDSAKKTETASSVPTTKQQDRCPQRLDPTISFANYPTKTLTFDTKLQLAEVSADEAVAKLHSYRQLAMVNYSSFIFPSDAEIRIVFEAAEKHLAKGCSAAVLLTEINDQRKPYVLRGLAWLCKLGLLHFL